VTGLERDLGGEGGTGVLAGALQSEREEETPRPSGARERSEGLRVPAKRKRAGGESERSAGEDPTPTDRAIDSKPKLAAG